MKLETILKILDGKKAIIAGIIITTAQFLAAKEIIMQMDATYIGAITTLIFGSAEVATPKFLGTRRK